MNLKKFAREILRDFPESVPDEWTIRDLAVECGILQPATVTAPCGETCRCAEYHGSEELAKGVTCYRRNPELEVEVDAVNLSSQVNAALLEEVQALRARLAEVQVDARTAAGIRSRYRAGESRASLADDYGLSETQIQTIVTAHPRRKT